MVSFQEQRPAYLGSFITMSFRDKMCFQINFLILFSNIVRFFSLFSFYKSIYKSVFFCHMIIFFSQFCLIQFFVYFADFMKKKINCSFFLCSLVSFLFTSDPFFQVRKLFSLFSYETFHQSFVLIIFFVVVVYFAYFLSNYNKCFHMSGFIVVLFLFFVYFAHLMKIFLYEQFHCSFFLYSFVCWFLFTLDLFFQARKMFSYESFLLLF